MNFALRAVRAQQMGDDFELREYQRKTELVCAEESLNSDYKHVQPGKRCPPTLFPCQIRTCSPQVIRAVTRRITKTPQASPRSGMICSRSVLEATRTEPYVRQGISWTDDLEDFSPKVESAGDAVFSLRLPIRKSGIGV